VEPIRVKADYPGVSSKEKILGVARTLGDPLRFRVDGVSFVEEPHWRRPFRSGIDGGDGIWSGRPVLFCIRLPLGTAEGG